MLKPLVEKIIDENEINRVYADWMYDRRKNFNYLAEKGIEPVIKTRVIPLQRQKDLQLEPKVVREMKMVGDNGWRDKYRYGYRRSAETFFSGVKRTFGETVRTRIKECFRKWR